MTEFISGREILLSKQEIKELVNKAQEFLGSQQGNKFLREFECLEAFEHSHFPFIDDARTYKADQYLTDKTLFSITNFGPATFVPELDKLIANSISTEDLWYYNTNKDLLVKKKWQGLEKLVREHIPNFESLYHKREINPTTGYIGVVKDEPNLRFFNKMWQNQMDETSATKLLSRGWVPIRWFSRGYILTKDDQKHYFDKSLGWNTADEWFTWIKSFKQANTYKDQLWEISSFHISNPSSAN